MAKSRPEARVAGNRHPQPPPRYPAGRFCLGKIGRTAEHEHNAGRSPGMSAGAPPH